MKSFKKILRKPVFWVVVVILVIVLPMIFFGSPSQETYDYTEASRGRLAQEVSVTGSVQPIEGVNLAFEQSGRVKRVAVGVHDEVYRGEPLVLLEANDLYADLTEAQANLEAEEAKLSELKRGPTDYEIKVKRAELDEAEQDLVNEYDDVEATSEDAYAQADDAVRTKTAELFRKTTDSYTLEYNACNSTAENQAGFYRFKSETVLNDWRAGLDSLEENSTWDDLDDALDLAQANLLEISRFLNYVGDTLVVGCELSDSDISTYRGKIGTARDNVSAALTAVNTLEQGIASEKSAVSRTERELEEILAGSSVEEIAFQEAAVKKASAQVSNINVQIEKTILRAPFSGKVTKVDADLGEIVDAYDPVVSVISSSGFKIEVNIPEVDVSKVGAGDKARVTLDAYGDGVVFMAEVITIDLAETVIEGISTYGATLEFEEPDERIKSGMTANVDVVTGMREDVIYVPQRAVIEEDGKKFVRILYDGTAERREVVTGLEDSLGNVEIMEGVDEGEKVVIFINEN